MDIYQNLFEKLKSVSEEEKSSLVESAFSDIVFPNKVKILEALNYNRRLRTR